VTFDRYSGRRKPERSDLFRAVSRSRGAENREAAKSAKTDAKKGGEVSPKMDKDEHG
jgi:hypothetical protein